MSKVVGFTITDIKQVWLILYGVLQSEIVSKCIQPYTTPRAGNFKEQLIQQFFPFGQILVFNRFKSSIYRNPAPFAVDDIWKDIP